MYKLYRPIMSFYCKNVITKNNRIGTNSKDFDFFVTTRTITDFCKFYSLFKLLPKFPIDLITYSFNRSKVAILNTNPRR